MTTTDQHILCPLLLNKRIRVKEKRVMTWKIAK